MLLSPAQLAAGDVLFVLTIEWIGRTIRWSTGPADVTWTRIDGAAAEAVLLDGGLDRLEVQRALGDMRDEPDLRSVSVDLLWPDDVALTISQGHDLSSATGELAMLCPGMDWRERVVLVRGQVSQPIYGGDGEPVSLSLVEEEQDDTASLISPTEIVTREKFPDCADAAVGRYYPKVLGTPGSRVLRDGTTEYYGAVPALCIEYDSAASEGVLLLVCAGRVAATTVRVAYQEDASTWSLTAGLPILYGTDANGNVYGYVDISGEAPEVRLAGAWCTAWTSPGLLSPTQTAGVSTVGDAMVWAASLSSIRCDMARWQGVADRLPWPIAGAITEPVAPLPWLADEILALVPVGLTWGVDGLGPVLWRHDCRRIDAVRTIRAGEGYHRATRVEYEKKPRDVINEWRLGWARDLALGQLRDETTLTPELARNTATSGTELGAVRQGAVLDSMRSRSMYRLTRSERIESDWVHDAGTAWRALQWRARASALSPRIVEYDCDTEVLELEEGDVVVLIDDELHLDVVAQVIAITITDAPMLRVMFRILDPATTLPLETPPYTTDDDPRYGEGQ